MKVVCGRCHHHFEVESLHEAHCPKCGAGAGLEVQHPSKLPIQAFGLLLFVCVSLAATSLGMALFC